MANRDIQILREVITKLAPMLAGKGFRVTQRGMQASVQTDVTGKPIVVNLPYIPDDASEDLILAIQGFLDHEVAHVLCTDWSVTKEVFEADRKAGFKPSKETPQGPRHWCANLVEDTFIEREMGKLFPGSVHNLERLHRFFIRKMTEPLLEKARKSGNPVEEFKVLMIPLIRALSGQVVFQDWLKEIKAYDNPFVDAFLKKFSKASQEALPKVANSREGWVIAQEIHSILFPKKAASPPPPSKMPPPEKSKDKGKPEKSDEKSEGQPGEPGDGEGDGEGEGTPSADPKSKKSKSKKKDKGEKTKNEDKGEDERDDTAGPDEGEADEPESDDAGEAEDGAEPEASDDGDDDGERDDAGADGEDADRGAGDDDAADPEDGESDDEGDRGADPGDEDDADGSSGSGADDEGEEEAGPDDGAGDDDEADAEGKEKAGGEDGDDFGAAATDGDAEEGEGDRQELSGTPSESTPTDSMEIFMPGEPPKDVIEALRMEISDEALRNAKDADYIIYSKDFDRIEEYEVTSGYQDSWLVRLDEDVRSMVGVMQKDIERMMAARSQVIKVPGYRSGRLHSAGLHRLSAGDDRVFRRKMTSRSKATAVGLLIDNSGSMSGPKMKLAMEAGYALSSTLERVGIPHECLGFTTTGFVKIPDGAWSREISDEYRRIAEAINEEAERLGRPFSRTEPIYMPIYKGFDERLTPTVRKRFADAAKTQRFLANNIDGECVENAVLRLLPRREERKVLLVLSDGFPACAGPSREQYAKLHSAVAFAQKVGVECIGIGIMSPAVKTFYPKHVVLNDIARLPETVMGKLKDILLAA